jgi:putative tricarboxylic transport membrane protein
VSLRSLTIRGADLGASVVFLALAALVIVEGLRLGAGWDERGPQAGFFPFWLAILMAFGACAAFIQALRRRFDTRFFEQREEWVELARVGVPLAAAIVVIPWTGLYVSTFLYVWLFAWWYGSFRWWTTLAGSVVFTGLLYFTLTTMRIPMPHSMFYERGLLPF